MFRRYWRPVLLRGAIFSTDLPALRHEGMRPCTLSVHRGFFPCIPHAFFSSDSSGGTSCCSSLPLPGKVSSPLPQCLLVGSAAPPKTAPPKFVGGVVSAAGSSFLGYLRQGRFYDSPRGTLDTPFPEHLSSTAKLCQHAINFYHGPRLLCRTEGHLPLEVVIRIMQALVDLCTPPPGAPSDEPAYTIVLEPQQWASRGGKLDRRDDGYDLFQGGNDLDDADDDVDGSFSGSEWDDDQDGPPDEGPVSTARSPISGGPSSPGQDHDDDAVFADGVVEQHPTNEHGPTGHVQLGTASGRAGHYVSRSWRRSRAPTRSQDTLFYLPETIRVQTPPPASLSSGGPRHSGACSFGVPFCILS